MKNDLEYTHIAPRDERDVAREERIWFWLCVGVTFALIAAVTLVAYQAQESMRGTPWWAEVILAGVGSGLLTSVVMILVGPRLPRRLPR